MSQKATWLKYRTRCDAPWLLASARTGFASHLRKARTLRIRHTFGNRQGECSASGGLSDIFAFKGGLRP